MDLVGYHYHATSMRNDLTQAIIAGGKLKFKMSMTCKISYENSQIQKMEIVYL